MEVVYGGLAVKQAINGTVAAQAMMETAATTVVKEAATTVVKEAATTVVKEATKTAVKTAIGTTAAIVGKGLIVVGVIDLAANIVAWCCGKKHWLDWF